MKRRKRISGIKDIGGVAQNALPIIAGVLVGRVLTKQLTFLSTGKSGPYVKIGLGLVGASMTSGFLSGLSLGLAVNGADEVATPMLQDAGIALLPPGQQTYAIQGLNDFGTRVIVQ